MKLSQSTAKHTDAFVYIRESWWRHQMETFSAELALCAGNSPVPVNSPHKGQRRGALMFSLICVWINGWVNNREAGDLRRHRAHCDVILMILCSLFHIYICTQVIQWNHWARVICVNKLTTIGLNNGLSPGRRQAIIWTNVDLLSIGLSWINLMKF